MNAKCLDNGKQPMNIRFHGPLHLDYGGSPVDRTERMLPPIRRYWDHALRCGFRSGSQQRGKKFHGNARHVTGNHQIQFGGRYGQSSHDAAYWSEARMKVGDHRKPQLSIAFRISHQPYRPDRPEHSTGDPCGQYTTLKWQQSLVLTHPPAFAARQHKTSGLASGSISGAVHEKIIALHSRKEGSPASRPRI